MNRCLWLLALAVFSFTASAATQVSGISFQQRLGSQLPLGIWLQDQEGSRFHLSDAFRDKPLILQLGYFRCPNLCGVVRADLLHALRQSGLVAGQDYTLVALSIDPTETHADAAAAKTNDLQHFPLAGTQADLHYVTASANEIQLVANAVGFGERRDTERNQYIHPAGIVFVTPTGVVSGYLLGVGYQSRDLRAAVERANMSKFAAAAMPVVLLCYDYDPTTGRYSLAIMKIVRVLAGLTALTVSALLFLAFRREGGPT